MGVAINTLNKTFDENGAVVEEGAARQIAILVKQVVDFARMSGAQEDEIA
jgi:hypothetical protein